MEAGIAVLAPENPSILVTHGNMSGVSHSCSLIACMMHIKLIKTRPKSRELAEVDIGADWWTNKNNMRERQDEHYKGEQMCYSYRL